MVMFTCAAKGEDHCGHYRGLAKCIFSWQKSRYGPFRVTDESLFSGIENRGKIRLKNQTCGTV
jgi:hypothetical protein